MVWFAARAPAQPTSLLPWQRHRPRKRLGTSPKSPKPTRRLRSKISPLAGSANFLTSVKSKAGPTRRTRARTADGSSRLPAAKLPLDLLAAEGGERKQMLKRLFLWPSKLLSGFYDHKFNKGDKREKQDVLRDVLEDMRTCSMSTAFSGIDTPATAWMMVASALVDELGMDYADAPRPANIFAIERHAGCQVELMLHPHPAEHVFSDITEFWDPSLKMKLENMAELNLEQELLLPLIKSGKAVQRGAWCVKHQKLCQARHGRVRW